MGPNVFIHVRDASGTGRVPDVMQHITLDVGSNTSLAMIRLPVPAAEGQQPEIEWCRKQLSNLVTKWKGGVSLAPAEIELEDGVTLEAVVDEVQRAISAPGGISASFRGR